MTRPAVVSLLWERHLGALDHFLSEHGPAALVVPAGSVSQRLSELADAHGVDIVTLEGLLPPGYNSVVAATEIVDGLHAHVRSPAWHPSDEREARVDALRAIVGERIDVDVHAAVQLIDCLRLAEDEYELVLLVTSEDVTNGGRVATAWARANGVPSLHLAHAIALIDPYTVHAHLEADVLAVYGDRGAEGYLDLGIDPRRIEVTGNPAWDVYRELPADRAAVRRRLESTHGLDPALPVVVFGTTWSAHLTATDPGDAHEQTLRVFVRACEELAESGVRVNAVIKDRPSNHEHGRLVYERVLGEIEPVQRYVYTSEDTAEFAASSDVLVAVDSNYLVEAMLCGVLGVNVVGWAGPVTAPAFEEGSGITEAEPDQLARRLAELLGDPDVADARRAQMAASVTRYDVAVSESTAASRVGRLMTRMALDGAATRRRTAPVRARRRLADLARRAAGKARRTLRSATSGVLRGARR